MFRIIFSIKKQKLLFGMLAGIKFLLFGIFNRFDIHNIYTLVEKIIDIDCILRQNLIL